MKTIKEKRSELRITDKEGNKQIYKGFAIGEIPNRFGYIRTDEKEGEGISKWFNFNGMTWINKALLSLILLISFTACEPDTLGCIAYQYDVYANTYNEIPYACDWSGIVTHLGYEEPHRLIFFLEDNTAWYLQFDYKNDHIMYNLIRQDSLYSAFRGLELQHDHFEDMWLELKPFPGYGKI